VVHAEGEKSRVEEIAPGTEKHEKNRTEKGLGAWSKTKNHKIEMERGGLASNKMKQQNKGRARTE